MSENGTPEGWALARLASIAEVRLGRQRSPARAEGPHMRPYMRAANVTWRGIDTTDVKRMDFTPAECETYGLRRGDILLGEASGSPEEVGKAAIWRDEVPGACFQNTLIRVRPAAAYLVPFLHLHFVRDGRTGRFAAASRGVGIHHLGAEALSNWEVVLPPVHEQHRIVEAIESYFTRLDDAVATLERVQQNLKRYRASVLKAAVEGRLVPTRSSRCDADTEVVAARARSWLGVVFEEQRRLTGDYGPLNAWVAAFEAHGVLVFQTGDVALEEMRGFSLAERRLPVIVLNAKDAPRRHIFTLMHGIGPDDDHREPPIRTDDALRDEPGEHFDVVVTNPPFGKRSSITVVNEEGGTDRETLTYNRPDFWTTTSNKQLNFVQHVKSLLRIHGRAAVVVPDNVLFEGGAGETVRRKLLHECDVHTLLRLPTGIFYAQGVKANVVFFDRKPGAKEPWTKRVWVYDLRTNKNFTLKTKRMTRAVLDDFVACYKPGERQKRKPTWSERNSEGRWRAFTYGEIVARDKASLDLFWLRDESLENGENLPDPHILAQEIADDLRSALGQIEDILGDLERRVAANGGTRRGA